MAIVPQIEVEHAPSKQTLHAPRRFEARATARVRRATAQLVTLARRIAHGAHVAKVESGTSRIDKAVGGKQMEQVGVGIVRVTTPPRLGPTVLAVVAVPFLTVVAALITAIRTSPRLPTFPRVDVPDQVALTDTSWEIVVDIIVDVPDVAI